MNETMEEWDGVSSGRQHTCFSCGKTGVWGPAWSWYGSYKDLDEGAPIEKFCSPTCQEQREIARERNRLDAELKQAAIDREVLERRAANLQSRRDAIPTLGDPTP